MNQAPNQDLTNSARGQAPGGQEKATIWMRRCQFLQRIADGMSDHEAKGTLSRVASQWGVMARQLQRAGVAE